jgi:hypothetical protein
MLLFDTHKVMEEIDQVMSVFAKFLGWQVTRQEEERNKLKMLMKGFLMFD